MDLVPLTLAHTGSVSKESGSVHQEVARAPRLPLPMVLQNLCTTGTYNPEWAHGYRGGSHKALAQFQPQCFSYFHVSNILWILIQIVPTAQRFCGTSQKPQSDLRRHLSQGVQRRSKKIGPMLLQSGTWTPALRQLGACQELQQVLVCFIGGWEPLAHKLLWGSAAKYQITK